MKTSFVALVSTVTLVGISSAATAQTIPPTGLNFSGPVTVGAPQVNAPVAAPNVNVDSPQISVDKPVNISAPVTVKPDIPVGAVQVQPGAVQVRDNTLNLVNAPNLGDAAQLQTKSVTFPGFSSSRPVAEFRGGIYPACGGAPISSSQIWGACAVTGKFEFAVPTGGGLSKTEKRARAIALFKQEVEAAKLLAEADPTMQEESLKLVQEALKRYKTALGIKN